jgi:hypothetical protein
MGQRQRAGDADEPAPAHGDVRPVCHGPPIGSRAPRLRLSQRADTIEPRR